MNRQELERVSHASAGVIDSTDKWHWVKVLGEFEMYVMQGDQSVSPHLIKDGFWESWITTWLMNNLDGASVFWDVGANTGYYSLLARHLGAMVSLYEPNPDYLEMIEATRERLGIGFGFTTSPTAASDEKGTATLYVPANLHGSASLRPLDDKWESRKIEVQTAPLLVGGAGRHFIKIDAEGAEEKIWRGMKPGLTDGYRPHILLEYTPGMYSDKFLDELEDYSPLRWINHDGVDEPVDRNWIAAQDDWFMMYLKGRY